MTKRQTKKYFEFQQIGTIHTPYVDTAPYQPVTNDEGDFWIVLHPEYAEGLADLEIFRYIYVLYFIDRLGRSPVMIENPSWTPDTHVGLFASRSPARPNPIGLSITIVLVVAGCAFSLLLPSSVQLRNVQESSNG